MINIFQLYGTFILTILGFVVPILSILISIFPNGIKILTEKYDNEKKQSEEKIKSQTEKKEQGKNDLDYKNLEKTLKTLRKQNKEAKTRLFYLKPGSFLFKTSIPFIIALVSVFLGFLDFNIEIRILLLISSLVSTVAGFLSLYIGIKVIFEVSEITNSTKEQSEEKMIDLLSILVEKTGENPYLKEEDIIVNFYEKSLVKNTKIDFSVDKKYEIPISIHNKSDKMAKNIEVGFVFPNNIVIEKTSNFEITTTENNQILRFKEDGIQAHNDKMQGKINLTFIESGLTKIDLFSKGENVKYRRFTFELNIIK